MFGRSLFFTTIFTLYSLANLYIIIKFRRAAPDGAMKLLVTCVILLIALIYPTPRIWFSHLNSPIAGDIILFGAYYLCFMVYFVLINAPMDFLKAALDFFPSASRFGEMLSKPLTLIISSLVVVLIVFIGHINASHPRVVELDATAKISHIPSKEYYKIIFVSDLHVGRVLGNSWLSRLIDTINSLDGDIVLLGGDVVDGDVDAAAEEGLSHELARLKAPSGVFAVLGNHEYHAGLEESVRCMEDGKVTMLLDEKVTINGDLTIAGRLSSTSLGEDPGRKPLADILINSADAPVILLDHSPVGLDDAMNNKVFLQLSGHTHHGQLFPFNFITDMIYEQDWGLLSKGNTLYYVSCGVGTWGPPVRTSSIPEIVVFNIKLEYSTK